jgi:AP-3 complex subunit delta-1
MFEKSLKDLIKGLRSNKKDDDAYIQACIAECRTELSINDPHLQTQALLKLTYVITRIMMT